MIEEYKKEIEQKRQEIQEIETAIEESIENYDFQKAGMLTHNIYHLRMAILFNIEKIKTYE